ncbi:MAG TPA: hypothetical protein VIT92_01970 [Burkholderiaceae bacterium]
MRTSLSLVLATLLATLSGTALAQTPVPVKPADAPPKLQPIEDTEGPTVTISDNSKQKKIVEKRQNGRVVEAKVTSGNSTYTLKPNVPANSAFAADGNVQTARPPQWTVKEFNLGEKKKPEQNTDGAAGAVKADSKLPDGPPPPRVAPEPEKK